jgi:hypothetical protein|tara:strand:- start:4978 stop:5388 length:411 start_codon:yes stop_codon:yes gene_type:complete
MRKVYDVVVDGEPASAKNQRRIVQVKGKPRLIKSKKALDYTKEFYAQAPVLNPLLDCDMCLLVDVWYASRRPDLACVDLIQDLLQGVAYENDRSIKVSQSIWNLDREHPRVRIRLGVLPPSAGYSKHSQLDLWNWV